MNQIYSKCLAQRINQRVTKTKTNKQKKSPNTPVVMELKFYQGEIVNKN